MIGKPSPERARIDADVLEWIHEENWQRDEKRFDALAQRIFRHQFEHCPPYARFAKRRAVTPESIANWKQIPAVPSAAFKEMALRSFPEEETKLTFRTSGTSGAKRGELHLDTLTLYQSAALACLRRLLLPELAPHLPVIRVLAPSSAELPDSSLSLMFEFLIEDFGAEASSFDIQNGEIQTDALTKAIEDCNQNHQPMILCGTAFAFVHLLDQLSEMGLCFQCPADSRIMETGGFKGRSRELSRADLHASLSKTFGVDPSSIINQYGMTELGSQFYDSTLVDPSGTRRKLIPPWVAVRIIDPETSREVAPGEVGMVTLHDLANTGSIAAIQTADLGREIPGDPSGFEVLGRQPGAEERGCSIAADEMLEN
ncbi:MAG: hypothetical protein VX252_00345 [Myxococcota bacterium]|nr:hypothetical protein [Myxococcota bacterium]